LSLAKKSALLPYFHLLVEAALFGKIAYIHHIVGCEFMPVENYTSFVGSRNVIDDADQSGLASSVGAQQAVDTSFWDRYADIVQSRMPCVAFRNVFCF